MDKLEAGQDDKVSADDVSADVKNPSKESTSNVEKAEHTTIRNKTQEECDKTGKKHKDKSRTKVSKLVTKLISISSKQTVDKVEEKSKSLTTSQVKRKLSTTEDDSEKRKRKKLFDISLKRSFKKDLNLTKPKIKTKLVSGLLDSKKVKRDTSTPSDHSMKTKEELRVEKDLIEIFGSASPPQTKSSDTKAAPGPTSERNLQDKPTEMSCSQLKSNTDTDCGKKAVLSMEKKYLKKGKDKGLKDKLGNRSNGKESKASRNKVEKSKSATKKTQSVKSKKCGNVKTDLVTQSAKLTSVKETQPVIIELKKRDSESPGVPFAQSEECLVQSVTEKPLEMKVLSDVESSDIESQVEVRIKQSELCNTYPSVVSSRVDFNKETICVGAYNSQISEGTDSGNSGENLHLQLTTEPIPVVQTNASSSVTSHPLSTNISQYSQNIKESDSGVNTAPGLSCDSRSSSTSNSRRSSKTNSRESSRSNSRDSLRSSLRSSLRQKLGTGSSREGSRPSSRQSQREQGSPDKELVSTEDNGIISGICSKGCIEGSSNHSSRKSSNHSSRDSSPPNEECSGMEQLRRLSEQLSSLETQNILMPSPLYRQPAPAKTNGILNRSAVSPRRTRLKSLSPWKGLQTSPGYNRKYTSGRSPKFSPRRLGSPRMVRSPDKSRLKRRLYERSPGKLAKRRKVASPEKKSKKKLQVKFNFSSSDNSSPGDWISEHGSPTSSSPGNQIDEQLSEDDDSVVPYFPKSPLSSDASDGAENQLAIDFELKELDIELDNKSKKLKLTARNVKSLICEVIKNEHVSDLFRKSLLDNGLEDQLKEAIFEPKMTRSRVKEVIQNGNFPPPWTLSPIKGLKQVPKETQPRILDINFSDNEDDQEYKPTVEELEQTDDDDLSMMSSQASELGSPVMGLSLRQTLSTPKEMVFSRKLFTEGSSTPKSLTGQSDTEDEELIAGRTRSKLPLKDTPLEELESNFVAPDITPDMYDTSCNDKDWTCFLSSLNKDEHLNDTYDDEQNDPEFNFLEEQEQEELDKEDYRDDKAVRISKKELNELMDELFEAYGGADLLEDDENTMDSMNLSQAIVETPVEVKQEIEKQTGGEKTVCTSSVSEDSDPYTVALLPTQSATVRLRYPGHLPPLKLDPTLARLLVSDIIKIQTQAKDGGKVQVNTPITDLTNSLAMSPDELVQLQDQMRKHVQLLCQTYIQAENQSTLKNVSNLAKSYLTELQHLGEKSLQNGFEWSHFHSPNLSEALEITQTGGHEEDTAEVRARVKEKMIYCKLLSGPNFQMYGLSFWQMELFVSRKVFMFPQMLPESKFPLEDVTDKRRVVFTEAEDNLLIIGLQQFQHMPNKFYYIQRFLLPCKTQEQIRTHCKNLRGKRKQKLSSTLQEYLKSKKVPPFERYLQLEELSDVVPPRNRNLELLPRWWQVYLDIKNEVASTDNSFIPISPEFSGDEEQRKSPTYPALLKTKKVSRHEPTDKTVGLSGLQHFKTNISEPSSHSSSHADSPFRNLQQGSVTSPVTIATESPVPQGCSVRKRRDSASSTESAKSTDPYTSESHGVVDTMVTAPKTVAPVLHDNGTVSSVTVLSTVANIQHIDQAICSTSGFTKYSTTINSSQPSLNRHALATSLPDVDMNITNDLDAIHPSVSFTPTTGSITLSEAALFSSSSSSVSIPSTGVIVKSSVSSPIAHNTVNVSTPRMMDIDSNQDSNCSDTFVFKTPAKTCVTSAAAMDSPSLISSAMAEVIGVPVSELCTPEGIKKMGITPSKVPGIILSKGEKRAEVRKSLSEVYEAQSQQLSSQTTDTATEKAIDPKVEEKNKNLIMGILREEKERNYITETLENSQSPSHDIDFSQPSMNIPDTPEKLPSPAKSTQVTPVRDKLSHGVNFFKISPVDLNLIAENSTIFPDKPIQRLNDFDCESTLVTPKKVDFEDFYKDSPSSSRQSVVECNPLSSMPFGITALETPDTPSKTAVKLMAEMAQEILSPEKPPQVPSVTKNSLLLNNNSPLTTLSSSLGTPPMSSKNNNISPIKISPRMSSDLTGTNTSTFPCQSRKTLSFAGQISPYKSTTPVKIRTLLPDGPLPKTPENSPMFRKTKTNPRRKILKQKARAIAPKGLVQIATYLSPVKQVAAAISARAKTYVSPHKKPQCRLRTLLPKSPKTPPAQAPTGKRRIFSPTEELQSVKKDSECGGENLEGSSDKDKEEEFVMTRRQRRLLKKQRTEQLKEEDKENDTPSDGGQDSQDEMDEEEQEHLVQLMAASTTIRFDPRQQDNTQLRSKGQIKKDTILEMLAPNILEADPLRDERDTAFAQSYMNKVRESLKNESEKYSKFLSLLYEFGSSKSSPTDLYTDMYHLFAGHPELLEDFSSFLLPGQAKDCGCLMAHLEFQKARTFLRKLEVHFKRLPGMLQRVLKSFAKWESLPTKNIKDLQDEIRPLLKGQQYLLDEFATFFADERVPDSYMTDFEDVNFLSGDEETADQCDGYEEVTITGGDSSPYGTKMCKCQCHSNAEKAEYRERKKHCISCGIKIIKGRLYLQCDNRLRRLHIKYSHPVKMPAHMQGISGEQGGEDVEELESNEEEEDLVEEEEEVVEEEEVDDEEVIEDDEEEKDDLVEDDEEVIEDDEEVIEDDEEDKDDLVEDDDEEVVEDDEDKEEVQEDDEDIIEDDEKDDLQEDEDDDDDGVEEVEFNDDDEDMIEDEEKDDHQEDDEDDGVEEVEFIDEDIAEEEDLSLSEGEDGDDKDALDDDDDEEFSGEEEEEDSDVDHEEEVEDSELDEDGAGTAVSAEKTEDVGGEDLDKDSEQPPAEESEQCPVEHSPTDFSNLTEEIQFVKQQSESATLGFRSSDSNNKDQSNTKLSEKSSEASVSSSNVDSSSGHTETSHGSGDGVGRTVQALGPDPPVVVDEAASFNLVTHTEGGHFLCAIEEETTMDKAQPPLLVTERALFGEVSDTEDNTMGMKSNKQDSESLKSSGTLQEATAEDTDVEEEDSGMGHMSGLEKWSIEEDKLILEKVQISGPTDQIFNALALLLNKTAQQVEVRFATLLALLTAAQETSDCQSDDNK